MPFFRKDDQLQSLGDRVLERTLQQFPIIARNQIAMTWLVYDPPCIVNTGGAITPAEFWQQQPRGYSYRGVERIYPASVVKLFYLVAIHEWLERGMTQPTAELERAMRDMITESSNDGTGLVVDVLTGTTSGPELAPGPFETWKQQRNIINRYFQSLDWEELKSINACQKTWGDGPYGREKAFYGEGLENRNMLTTEATARLVHSIIGGVAVSSSRSQAMMNVMRRSIDPQVNAADPENQVTEFLGAALPQSATLWSKCGYTSWTRHDAAYIEIPGLRPYLLTVFTDGREHNQEKGILPFVSQQVIEAMQEIGA
ncbi:serine hydrolase [filamentous cyanobacterium LEGE 11480]|uniref:Serine hydrolase n=1 Tax=Romeriopsis navalis LEGE 11480 TaxID=2777977 RepID=A0A928VJ82_9CYAN|nr:class A beta-lactamase-related serine hydrolase [Romeriopsis navalis]MBE9028748.1 serine hydrolase [Romeriopsis navalis LEGE 11480]